MTPTALPASAASHLASTGADVLPVLVIAGALIVAGIVFVVIRAVLRRRANAK